MAPDTTNKRISGALISPMLERVLPAAIVIRLEAFHLRRTLLPTAALLRRVSAASTVRVTVSLEV